MLPLYRTIGSDDRTRNGKRGSAHAPNPVSVAHQATRPLSDGVVGHPVALVARLAGHEGGGGEAIDLDGLGAGHLVDRALDRDDLLAHAAAGGEVAGEGLLLDRHQVLHADEDHLLLAVLVDDVGPGLDGRQLRVQQQLGAADEDGVPVEALGRVGPDAQLLLAEQVDEELGAGEHVAVLLVRREHQAVVVGADHEVADVTGVVQILEGARLADHLRDVLVLLVLGEQDQAGADHHLLVSLDDQHRELVILEVHGEAAGQVVPLVRGDLADRFGERLHGQQHRIIAVLVRDDAHLDQLGAALVLDGAAAVAEDDGEAARVVAREPQEGHDLGAGDLLHEAGVGDGIGDLIREEADRERVHRRLQACRMARGAGKMPDFVTLA